MSVGIEVVIVCCRQKLESSCRQLNEIPDEPLITICKKLFNTEVLNSFIGSNHRRDTIVHGASFTHRLLFMTKNLDGLIYLLADTIIDRFCWEI